MIVLLTNEAPDSENSNKERRRKISSIKRSINFWYKWFDKSGNGLINFPLRPLFITTLSLLPKIIGNARSRLNCNWRKILQHWHRHASLANCEHSPSSLKSYWAHMKAKLLHRRTANNTEWWSRRRDEKIMFEDGEWTEKWTRNDTHNHQPAFFFFLHNSEENSL